MSKCNAAFVADVTIPDDTVIQTEHAFEKTWRIRNSGSVTWTQGFELTRVGGEPMGVPSSVRVPNVAPGEAVDVTVPMVAPSVPGRHRSEWRMCANVTECFGERVFVQIVSVAPTPTPGPTPVPLVAGQEALANCLACAAEPPWLLQFRSEPGVGAGVILGGVRHGERVALVDAEWSAVEGKWWYLVDGWDEYTGEVGRSVSGWVPGTNLAIDTPAAYPLGNAWIEFAIGAQEGIGVRIWSRPGYYTGARGVGEIWHGTRVEIIATEWDADNGAWFYQASGRDYQTGETVTGWVDGVFLVLSSP